MGRYFGITAVSPPTHLPVVLDDDAAVLAAADRACGHVATAVENEEDGFPLAGEDPVHLLRRAANLAVGHDGASCKRTLSHLILVSQTSLQIIGRFQIPRPLSKSLT